MKETTKPTQKPTPTPVNSNTPSFVFDKENYKWMLIGLAIVVFGFILMVGGGSDDPTKFSDEIFNFRRITLAPIMVMTGFIVEIYAIMRKPKA